MKKKVLIIQAVVPHYREIFFQKLAYYYDLTIMHSGQIRCDNDCSYKEIFVERVELGPFKFQKQFFNHIFKGYDVVIAMCDFHWPLNILGVFYHPIETKYVFWGCWLTDKFLIDRLKIYFARKAYSNIFYCAKDKDTFLKKNVPEEKLFVANNTVYVGNRRVSYLNENKFRILFVGTLDVRKENFTLIEAFNSIKKRIDDNIILTIIGEGNTKDALIKLVRSLDLCDRVCFLGSITDVDVLAAFYSESIVSVSYGQAGLTVLQSFGFGVPFITRTDAISGGEKNNIVNGYNGYFCDGSQSDLEGRLMLLCNDIDMARKMGENAFDFYTKNCTIDKMVEGFIAALK